MQENKEKITMTKYQVDGSCVIEIAPWLEKALENQKNKTMSVAAPIVDQEYIESDHRNKTPVEPIRSLDDIERIKQYFLTTKGHGNTRIRNYAYFVLSLNVARRCGDIVELRRHNEDYEKQVEAGMKAKGTLLKYRTVYKHLQEFLTIRYHVKDIALKELTPAFISDFEMFLRTDKHCCTNTVWLYVCPLRTMVFIAINNEWLTRDPFREYEIKKEETTRSFLTKEEIRLLMEGKLKNAKQELYRDLYLFCAFTGLSFSDMRNLTDENIRTYFDEHEWININRQKTGVVSNIRLLDIANRIIGKYRGLCGDGRIFPVPHYNTCLAGIRAVAKRCGITKHITWHQSRHTAATTVFLSNGVPIETVSSMLGHKSIKTTQIYAKITKEKLNQDMENLAARLNGIEEFAGCTI